MLFIVALSLTNCQVEEIATDKNSIKTVSKEDAMLYLAQNTITSRSIKGKKQAETADLNNVTQEKITNSDQLLTVIPLSNNTSTRYSRIILIKIKDELKSVVFTMYPAQNYLTEEFTGKIIITNLEGNFINGYNLKKGTYISQYFKKRKDKFNSNLTNKSIVIDGVLFEELNEVTIINNYHSLVLPLEYMGLINDIDFGAPLSNNFNDSSSDSDTRWNYGGGSSSYGEDIIDDNVANELEGNIDDTELDDCNKAILDKLKNLTQSDIASIFEKFGTPTDGTYNIKIVLGNPNDMSALAQTETISKNNYLITISEAYIKGTPNNPIRPTDLSIAAVLIHELIHAHFKALFDDFHNNGDTCAYDNYDCLYEKYATKNYVGKIDAQHAQMFDNYVPITAAILHEFKPGS